MMTDVASCGISQNKPREAFVQGSFIIPFRAENTEGPKGAQHSNTLPCAAARFRNVGIRNIDKIDWSGLTDCVAA